MNLIQSRKRVADHGEVFTPAWMVDAMLDLVKDESERIDSRFLEPACGSGNFIVKVLQRKLAAVESKFGKSNWKVKPGDQLDILVSQTKPADAEVAGFLPQWGLPLVFGIVAAASIIGAPIVYLALKL